MLMLRSAVIVALVAISATSAFGARTTPLKGTPPGQLIAKVKKAGRIRVIIGARDNEWKPEGSLKASHIGEQRQRIKSKVSAVIDAHANLKAFDGWRFITVPAFVVEVGENTLLDLMEDERVESIEEDLEGELLLKESTLKIGAPAAHNRTPIGYKGSGKIVVVIDTGVDKGHPFFGTPSRVLDASGACFSAAWRDDVDQSSGGGTWASLCPNGQTTQIGAGASAPCAQGDMTLNANACNHGTRVAGVAAGDNQQVGSDRMTGVAPAASIVAIQVASKSCATPTSCTTKFLTSSVIFALDYVASELFDAHGSAIAAVNISLALGDYSSTHCDADNTVFYNAVANVRSKQIPVVAGTGNAGSKIKIRVPACLSNVIGVSATDDADQVASYADVSPVMHLFAPGGLILAGQGIMTSQNRGCGSCALYWEDHGTSMAAPHVAAAFALLRERHPSASVDDLLGTLVRTGVMVTDNRTGNTGLKKPRININEALDETIVLAAPSNLSARAIASGTIQLTWNAPTPASQRTSYRVRFRTALANPWTVATSTTTTTFTHENITPGALYQYEVVTTDTVGNFSAAATDYGLPLFHEDDPLVPTSTLVKGIHLARLRAAANAWRQFAGLGALPSDSPTGVVQASQLIDVRDRLNEARALMSLLPFSYSAVNLPALGTAIDARHVDQLRTAMR
jgi:subtilisin family serine protease